MVQPWTEMETRDSIRLASADRLLFERAGSPGACGSRFLGEHGPYVIVSKGGTLTNDGRSAGATLPASYATAQGSWRNGSQKFGAEVPPPRVQPEKGEWIYAAFA